MADKVLYATKVNGNPLAASAIVPGSALADKIAEIEQEIISTGSFEVVPLTSGANPVPDVANPKTTVIYLTKEAGSSKTDPYTEWIWFDSDGSGPASASWQIIGETSLDLSGYKTKQTAVSVTGGTLKGVASFSQNENGEVTLTLNDIQDGTTSQKGVVQLEDSHTSTSTTTAATPKNVKEAYDLADSKYAKPSGGIPKTDLVSGVQSSLDAADTAVQSVKLGSSSGTELKSGTNVVIPQASASATGAGVVELAGSIGATVATENNKAATEKAVRDAITALNVDTKADKVTGAVEGNFAGLDANGNLTDSGSKASDFKTKQSAVSDPTADGTTITAIDTISQDTNGVITATKKTIRSASTSQSGIVQLQDSIGASEASDTTAATPKAVRDAINALDVTAVTVGASKTLASISETDGKISATAVDIQIAESQVTNLTTDLGNKEDKSNKVTSWSATVTDTNYPSEKLVKDSLDNKANKVASATSGNFAGLNASGNLTDSGSKASDFATAAQGTKADSAIQGVKANGTALIPDGNKVVDIPVAAVSTYGVVTVETQEI